LVAVGPVPICRKIAYCYVALQSTHASSKYENMTEYQWNINISKSQKKGKNFEFFGQI
jgi:hypothetical protein